MSIHRAIQDYFSDIAASEHHRYRSWEHCYTYFQSARKNWLSTDRDHAALQLGFYLASWGMYRGSSFLLQYAFTVHRSIIDLLADTRFNILWELDFGANEEDYQHIPLVCELINHVNKAYASFAQENGSGAPSDTLITKVVLGTFGCLPACDRFFINGFKHKNFKYSYLNKNFIERILDFCQQHLYELQEEQATIKRSCGVRYPLMKLIDMYFWQVGYEEGNTNRQGRF